MSVYFIFSIFRHSSIISIRFKYTLPQFVLPPLSCSLQYTIPDNISFLISNLTDSDAKNDSRFVAYSSTYAKLIETVTETSKILENDPSWFIDTHWRVAQPLAVDEPDQVSIRKSMDKLNQESENSERTKLQEMQKSKITSDLPDELPDGCQSVTSSEILQESEYLTDSQPIQIAATAANDVDTSDAAYDFYQFNFLINDNNSSGKRMHNDGQENLHDSGFLSGKDVANI